MFWHIVIWLMLCKKCTFVPVSYTKKGVAFDAYDQAISKWVHVLFFFPPSYSSTTLCLYFKYFFSYKCSTSKYGSAMSLVLCISAIASSLFIPSYFMRYATNNVTLRFLPYQQWLKAFPPIRRADSMKSTALSKISRRSICILLAGATKDVVAAGC